MRTTFIVFVGKVTHKGWDCKDENSEFEFYFLTPMLFYIWKEAFLSPNPFKLINKKTLIKIVQI